MKYTYTLDDLIEVLQIMFLTQKIQGQAQLGTKDLPFSKKDK